MEKVLASSKKVSIKFPFKITQWLNVTQLSRQAIPQTWSSSTKRPGTGLHSEYVVIWLWLGQTIEKTIAKVQATSYKCMNEYQ